jgi:hypothetical protein
MNLYKQLNDIRKQGKRMCCAYGRVSNENGKLKVNVMALDAEVERLSGDRNREARRANALAEERDQFWAEAISGRELRTLEEWPKGWGHDCTSEDPWFVYREGPRGYDQAFHYPTLALAAAAVREWQGGQIKEASDEDGVDRTTVAGGGVLRGDTGDVCDSVGMDAVTPEDAARERIAAAGGTVEKRFEASEWRWVLRAENGAEWWVGRCGGRGTSDHEWDRAA